MNNELDLLKSRVDVMQRYVNDSVTGLEGDFKKLFDSIVTALNMMDARLTAIERALTVEIPDELKPKSDTGKEL